MASSAAAVTNPKPVEIKDGKKHKVKVFLSPDHSIQPVIDLISSATKSIDMYIPEWKTWTYPSNKPLVPAMWMKEENPIFRALVNAGVHKIKMRFLTQGPQIPNIPLSSDIWEWFIIQDAQVNFILPALVTIGGIMMIIDGGEKIFLTSMSGDPASFLYNRESSIILETKCDELVKLFQDTFDADFAKGIPFLPTKDVILNTKPPLLDPVSVTMMQTYVFKPISTRVQPPTALVKSPMQPYIFDVTEADDVVFTYAMAGPKMTQWFILRAINDMTYVQIATRSLTNERVTKAIYGAYKMNQATSVLLSYMLVDENEAKESDENILPMYNGGMNTQLSLGPLYNEKPETKDYYTHNGQCYMNLGDGTQIFMTGSLSSDDLNKNRNFYVAFQSNKIAEKLTDVYSKDKLFAKVWNPTDGTPVGPEKKLDEKKSDGDEKKSDGDKKKSDGDGDEKKSNA